MVLLIDKDKVTRVNWHLKHCRVVLCEPLMIGGISLLSSSKSGSGGCLGFLMKVVAFVEVVDAVVVVVVVVVVEVLDVDEDDLVFFVVGFVDGGGCAGLRF